MPINEKLFDLYSRSRDFNYYSFSLDAARAELMAIAEPAIKPAIQQFANTAKSTAEITAGISIACVVTQRLLDLNGGDYAPAFQWAIGTLYAYAKRLTIDVDGTPEEHLMFEFTIAPPALPSNAFDSLLASFLSEPRMNEATILKGFMHETTKVAARLMCINFNKPNPHEQVAPLQIIFTEFLESQKLIAKEKLKRFFREFNFDANRIDAANASFYTPLTWAAKLCDLPLCRMLVDAGANVNAGNGCDNTALHILVDSFSTNTLSKRIATFLLEQGAIQTKKMMPRNLLRSWLENVPNMVYS